MTAWVSRIGGNDVLRPAGLAGGLLGFLEKEIDLGGLEARQLDLEVEVDQGLQLDRQDLPVPAGLLGQSVVGKDVGPLLGLREVGQPTVGTTERPSSLAAATRPWPAMICPWSSISTGLQKPNRSMLLAIWRICFLEWVRALPVGLERFRRKHLHLQARSEFGDGPAVTGAVTVRNRVILRETRGFFETAHGALHENGIRGHRQIRKAGPDEFRRPGSPEGFGRIRHPA